MSPRIFELILDVSDTTRSRCRLITDASRVCLPEIADKTFVVLTASADKPDVIANSLGINDGDCIAIARSPVPVGELEPSQIAELFEDVIRSSLTQTSLADTSSTLTESCLFIGDIENLYPEVFPDLAWRFDGTYLGTCGQINVSETPGVKVTRKAFGGRLKATVECMNRICFASMRGGSKGVALETSDAIPPKDSSKIIDTSITTIPDTDYVVTSNPGDSRAEDTLTDASLIVSGGRGLGSEKNLSLLKEIALHMDASWAGSLPAVDAGWVPVTRQVGQSGNYVRPNVYLAIGISGTPQHMAGIDPITRIVAINNDPDASIFLFSEVGVVADCTTFLPVLLEEIKSRA
jgi:electron transfer flavoprotein alpha subunit